MTKFEFILSTEDTTRLFYLKQKEGHNDLTGNEFAEKLLHRYLYSQCQSVPEIDENGNYDFKD